MTKRLSYKFLLLTIMASLLFLTKPGEAATLTPFDSDGCSAFAPDGKLHFDNSRISNGREWVHCCMAHDAAYWAGGPEGLRDIADAKFYLCLDELDKKDKLLPGSLQAITYYIAVRIGGRTNFSRFHRPFPFSWGFGWKMWDEVLDLSLEQIQMVISELNRLSKQTNKPIKYYKKLSTSQKQYVDTELLELIKMFVFADHISKELSHK